MGHLIHGRSLQLGESDQRFEGVQQRLSLKLVQVPQEVGSPLVSRESNLNSCFCRPSNRTRASQYMVAINGANPGFAGIVLARPGP